MAITEYWNYSSGQLGTVSGNKWVEQVGSVLVDSSTGGDFANANDDVDLVDPAAKVAMAYYADVEFNADQTVDVTFQEVDTGSPWVYGGPAARCGDGKGYLFVITGGFVPYLYRLDSNTTGTQLAQGTGTIAIGEIARISVSGSGDTVTIECYYGAGTPTHEPFDGAVYDTSANRHFTGAAGIGFRSKEVTAHTRELDYFYCADDVAQATDVGDSRKVKFLRRGGFDREKLINTW